MSMAPVFHPILGIGSAVRCREAADLTPLESFFFTNRNRSWQSGESMRSKKPAGKRTKSAQANRNREWKALEVVHPHAAGIDIGGSEPWVAVSPERSGARAVLWMFYVGPA